MTRNTEAQNARKIMRFFLKSKVDDDSKKCDIVYFQPAHAITKTAQQCVCEDAPNH